MESTNPKIFIVEDQSIVAFDIECCLTAHNYDVVGRASSHMELMEKIGDSKPDLVLMDIRIEGDFDGIECAKQVRSIYQVPVVFLTAHSDKTTIERAVKTKAFGYILKPYNEKALVTNIEMALANHNEEQLRLSAEDGLTKTLNRLNIGIVIFNKAGIVTFLNIAARALTGWDKDKILDQPLKYFLVDKKLNKNFDVEKIIKKGIDLCHLDVVAQNNQVLHPMSFDLTISAIYQNGELTGGMAVFQDFGAIINSTNAPKMGLENKRGESTEVLEMCPWCKMWKDEKDDWNQIEEFIGKNTPATISHYICPDCNQKLIRSIQFNIEKDPNRRMN